MQIMQRVAFLMQKSRWYLSMTKKWYRCPHCKQKILKYDDVEGKSKKVYIICKSCKKEIEINIE